MSPAADVLRGEEILRFRDAAAWERWLEANHADRPGAWLRIAKKASALTTVTVVEALDVALCFGWIDGQRRSDDADHYLQRYSPRRARSSWSQVNVEKVTALAAAGRMRPPGLAEVAAAQADGRWDAAYERQRTAEVPPDLASALDADESARAFFASLGRTDRYAVLLRLMKARSPEERDRRLTAAVADLAAGRKVR